MKVSFLIAAMANKATPWERGAAVKNMEGPVTKKRGIVVSSPAGERSWRTRLANTVRSGGV